ncbi:flagellar biosynthetic protein FliR [Rhodanobacter denitrificans]|uniref:Flagellar biosynthetic protein FliR n=1 Tax=Rhodanobacter denitrificans TaxID=666685 RepID=U3GKC9_9GAMM|nr:MULTISPECIES: flagellar biosynthetic protein FliR [Rhodanobacter]AGG90060.1 flagellar biosynthetic protein FliR [Rhodanobacter denitrificans]EIM04682.1 flagellar biosynthetic protein FliR [Rhodanobacter denitrificans]UJJ57642.1 flagellar biosynthetic protein FliR [Rhodanobacter denitrificans]UJM85451.1 flagellar biosynthetic protein FliR [Rhodanobacter denitrificans]UJM91506.1 flagellar biosynthetic protein FliR [Rhodanobacter denitrificans]
MTALDLAQLPAWLGSLFWAVGRVSGLCLVAPVFSATVVSARVRVGVVVVLALVLAPLAPATIDPLSGDGVATMAAQVLIGAAVGFVLKLVFEAVSFGGELVGQSMSLGFAEVISPQAGGSSNVLSQFYLLLVTLLFLAMDGHLRLIALLADSFRSLPPGVPTIDANGLHAVVGFAAELFAGAVRVALPAVTSLLVVNIGFAAISRAAPSMNLFAVGFPITVSLGFIALWLSLRSLPGAFEALQDSAWSLMRQLFGG